MNDLTMYLLARTDLPSLKGQGGKLAAHAMHAGHQIMKYREHHDVRGYFVEGTLAGTDHFNTVITLGATKEQIDIAMSLSRLAEIPHGAIYDPTYPFVVQTEIVPFLNHEVTVVQPVGSGETTLCTRMELTCAWLLGCKSDLAIRGIVGHLSLHP